MQGLRSVIFAVCVALFATSSCRTANHALSKEDAAELVSKEFHDDQLRIEHRDFKTVLSLANKVKQLMAKGTALQYADTQLAAITQAKAFAEKYPFGVILGRFRLVNILGIRDSGDDPNTLIVVFAWKWDFDTDAGREFASLPVKAQIEAGATDTQSYRKNHNLISPDGGVDTVVLHRYDDVWRLENFD